MESLPDLAGLTHAQKDEVIHALWDLVTVLRQEVVELKAEVASLKMEVADLRGQLAKNSRNSSIPSSAEGLKKTKSMRKKGTRPPGGQPGHKGSTLEKSADPDYIVDHPLPSRCDACGAALNGDVLTETRQVFDLPPVVMAITEHHIHRTRCTCGKAHRSEFPSAVAAPVHHGPGVKALAVYLTQHHMLPVARTAQLLSDLHGLPISRGTIQTMIGEAGTLLAPTVAGIADAIARSDVAGADESGYRVAGKLNWLHTAVTDALTWMGMHARRGKIAFEAFGLLGRIKGTLVHEARRPSAPFVPTSPRFRNSTSISSLPSFRHFRATFLSLDSPGSIRLSDLNSHSHRKAIESRCAPMGGLSWGATTIKAWGRNKEIGKYAIWRYIASIV